MDIESIAKVIFESDALNGTNLLSAEDRKLLNECFKEYKEKSEYHLLWLVDQKKIFQCISNSEMKEYYEKETYKPLIEEIIEGHGVIYNFQLFKLFCNIQVLKQYLGRECSFKEICDLLHWEDI